jgi:hypothetical protein
MVDLENSNPLRILVALDGFLQAPFELIVYGRSALALGYPNPPAEFLATMDVDAILPSKDLQVIEAGRLLFGRFQSMLETSGLSWCSRD